VTSTPKVVILGASGMVGRAWSLLLERERIECAKPADGHFDLKDPRSIETFIPKGARTVINCAAFTDVDGAEANEAEATAVNGVALGPLLERCVQVNARLVHYSTDYVFSGDAREPYKTTTPLAPLGAYGRSKAVGEALIANSRCSTLLVRTSWVYAPWGKNFVRTIAELGRSRPELKVVDDQRGRPTSAEHLAATTYALVKRGASGTFHVTDGGECTWFQFAEEIVKLTSGTASVKPCTSAEYPRPARRPKYSVLDLSETEALLGPMPDWRTNLRDVCGRLSS
jgi:dTDP-4-dehydrorhamnose reductase